MDVSGALHVLLREYETSKGLFFENHIYGCVSLLEQWIEGSLDISGIVESEWDQIGANHGFYRPLIASAPYEGSAEYKEFWSRLFKQPPLSEKVLDDFEEALWKAYKAANAIYFCGALATGDLSAELLDKGLAETKATTGATVTTNTGASNTGTTVATNTVTTNTGATTVTAITTVAAIKRRRTRDAPVNRIITPVKTHRKFAFTRKGKTA